jgi:hypothetical protein
MLKMIALLKRRPGMSVEEFREYYETTHRLIGEKHLKNFATRYMRRFLNNLAVGPHTMETQEYDVITEAWFPDRQSLDGFLEHVAIQANAEEIAKDEANLFDRSRHQMFLVEEVESQLTDN